ncbi:hypothetical protein ACQ4WX_04800 [Streptomyces lasalocidi]
MSSTARVRVPGAAVLVTVRLLAGFDAALIAHGSVVLFQHAPPGLDGGHRGVGRAAAGRSARVHGEVVRGLSHPPVRRYGHVCRRPCGTWRAHPGRLPAPGPGRHAARPPRRPAFPGDARHTHAHTLGIFQAHPAPEPGGAEQHAYAISMSRSPTRTCPPTSSIDGW